MELDFLSRMAQGLPDSGCSQRSSALLSRLFKTRLCVHPCPFTAEPMLASVLAHTTPVTSNLYQAPPFPPESLHPFPSLSSLHLGQVPWAAARGALPCLLAVFILMRTRPGAVCVVSGQSLSLCRCPRDHHCRVVDARTISVLSEVGGPTPPLPGWGPWTHRFPSRV